MHAKTHALCLPEPLIVSLKNFRADKTPPKKSASRTFAEINYVRLRGEATHTPLLMNGNKHKPIISFGSSLSALKRK